MDFRCPKGVDFREGGKPECLVKPSKQRKDQLGNSPSCEMPHQTWLRFLSCERQNALTAWTMCASHKHQLQHKMSLSILFSQFLDLKDRIFQHNMILQMA